VLFQEVSVRGLLASVLISGCLVLLVAVGFLVWWKRYVVSAWRWLFLGAGVWFVGVVLKFVVANYANAPILTTIESVLGRSGYLTLGSAYIGLLTGVFEIGITLAFAWTIRRMSESADIGLSIGLGAGLVEAVLIGSSSIGSWVMVTAGTEQSGVIIGTLVQAATATPLLWLISAVERVIAILCHTSSRMLVLFSVAGRRQRYFWAGFLLMTALDVIAGYFHLAGLINKISTWWVELLLVPFAILSVLIIRWMRQQWRNSVLPVADP